MINIFDEVVFSTGQKLKLAKMVADTQARLKSIEETHLPSEWPQGIASTHIDLTPGIGVTYKIQYKLILDNLIPHHHLVVGGLNTDRQPISRDDLQKCATKIAKHLGFEFKEEDYYFHQYQDHLMAVSNFVPMMKKG